MPKNMSTLDRRLRTFLVAPLAIVIAFAIGIGSVAGVVLLVVAAIMVATGAVGFCPLYALVHLDSRGHRPLPH
jgi:hypothetical protein